MHARKAHQNKEEADSSRPEVVSDFFQAWLHDITEVNLEEAKTEV
jgi:hypothetical protein